MDLPDNMLLMRKLLILICLVEVSLPLGPSLEDLTHKQCPTLRPVLCLPYGLCCRFSEFCYAGLCESCFFEEVKVDLLGWCRNYGQHNVSLMRSPLCHLACQDEFTSQQLAVLNETIIYKEKDERIGKVQNSPENKDNYFGLLVALLVLVIVLTLIVIVTKIRKPLKVQLKPKFSRIRKSDTINTDLESPPDGSPTRNGQQSKIDVPIISNSNQPQASALKLEPDDTKKDSGEDGIVTQPSSNKKPTKSKLVPISSPIPAAASGSSKTKSEVQNISRNGHNPKNVVVHGTDTSEALPMANGLEINNLVLLASYKPKKDDCMINICRDDNDIDDEDLNSYWTPLLAKADKDNEKGLRVPLPAFPSYEKKHSHVSEDNYNNPLSSANTSSSSKEPKATIPRLEEDMFHVNTNFPIQAHGGSQRNDEELGAAACPQDEEMLSLGSSCADPGIYKNQIVKLDNKKGAKASITDNESISQNGHPKKSLDQHLGSGHENETMDN